MHRIRLFGMLAGAAVAAFAASPASAQTDVKFALDWKFEGPAAPYFVAIDKGYYKAEGLNVTIDSGRRLGRRHRARRGRHLSDRLLRHQFAGQVPRPEPGQDGQGRADGLRQAAVRHRHHRQDRHHQAEGPRRQDARRARRRRRLRAVEGRSCRRTASTRRKVKIENIGFPVREPMLADGKVDAITGFSFSMHYQPACRRALKPDDIKTMLMADYGLVLYGNAIMVNPDFAKANPEGGGRLRARHHQGRARHHQGPGRGDQIGDEAQRDRRREDRARAAQDVAARQLRDARG